MSAAGSARDLYLRILVEARGVQTLSQVQQRIQSVSERVAKSLTVLGQYSKAIDLLRQRLARMPSNAPLEARLKIEASLQRAITARSRAEERAERMNIMLTRSEAQVSIAQGDRAKAATILRGSLGTLTAGTIAYNRVLAQAITLEKQAAAEATRKATAMLRSQAQVAGAGGDKMAAAGVIRGGLGAFPAGSLEYNRLLAQAIRLEKQAGDEATRRGMKAEKALATEAQHESNLAKIRGNNVLALQKLQAVLPSLTKGTQSYYQVRERIARIEAEEDAKPGIFSRALGTIGKVAMTMSRVLAITFLWVAALRIVGNLFNTFIFKPLFAIGKAVLTATESFRQLGITFSGITGSLRSSQALIREIGASARGLPVTALQAAESVRQTAFIPLVARKLQAPGAERQQFERDIIQTMLGLSTINPQQGTQGAGFAIREALAGQFRSIRLRFDISPDVIASSIGKSVTELRRDPALTLKAIQGFVNAFVGPDVLKAMQETLTAQGNRFHGLIQEFLATIGDSGFYDTVVGRLKQLNNALDDFLHDPAYEKQRSEASKRISNALTSVFESLIDAADKMLTGLTGKNFRLRDVIAGDAGAIGEAFASLVEVLKDAATAIISIAAQLAELLGSLLNKMGVRTPSQLRADRAMLVQTRDTNLRNYQNRMDQINNEGTISGFLGDAPFGRGGILFHPMDPKVNPYLAKSLAADAQARIEEIDKKLDPFGLGAPSAQGSGNTVEKRVRRISGDWPGMQDRLGEQRARIVQGLTGFEQSVTLIEESLRAGAAEIGPKAITLEQAFRDVAQSVSDYGLIIQDAGKADEILATASKALEDVKAMRAEALNPEEIQALDTFAERISAAMDALRKVAKGVGGLKATVNRAAAAAIRFSLEEAGKFGPTNQSSVFGQIGGSAVLAAQGREGSIGPFDLRRFAVTENMRDVIPRDIDTLHDLMQIEDQLRQSRATLLERNQNQHPAMAASHAARQEVTALEQLARAYEDPSVQKALNIPAELGEQFAAELRDQEEAVKEQFDRYRQFVREFTADVGDAFKTGIGDVLIDIMFEAGQNLQDILTNLGKTIARILIDQVLQIALVENFIHPVLTGLLKGAAAAPSSGGSSSFDVPSGDAQGGVHFGRIRPVHAASGWIASRPHQLLEVAEGGTPEAVVPLRGGGVPVRWTNRRSERTSADTFTIINTIDPAAVVRAGATRDPRAVVNPVVADMRGRGLSRRVIRRDRRR